MFSDRDNELDVLGPFEDDVVHVEDEEGYVDSPRIVPACQIQNVNLLP